jgi:hypothetical protein
MSTDFWFWVVVAVVGTVLAAIVLGLLRWLWERRVVLADWLWRPKLTPGTSQFRVADATNKASLRFENRGRRGKFHANVEEVHRFLIATGPVKTGHLVPPWQVPWCPGEGWWDGPAADGGERDLLHRQSDLLCVGWLEMNGPQPSTFSVYGTDHHQPYPIGGVAGIKELEMTVRVFNKNTGRSWAWDVTFIFSPDAIDPEVRIRRHR